MNTISLSREEVADLLNGIRDLRVGVIGDICLDYYLFADMRLSTLSRETPHFPLPIVKERFTPGGGGNLIWNIAALKPGKVIAVSVVGDDWRGNLLLKLLQKEGVDVSKIIINDAVTTNAYCKPMRMGISDVIYEDPRLDFENREPLPEDIEDDLLDALDQMAEQVDIIAVADQLTFGVVTEKVRNRLELLGRKLPIIVDSRDRGSLFRNVIIKPNEVEAAVLAGIDIKSHTPGLEEYLSIGSTLSNHNGQPVIITLGSVGAIWCDQEKASYAPAVEAKPPIDIVGAGDTFLAAFTAVYGNSRDGGKAVAFANLASAVTIKKIGITGTATYEEILNKYEEIYHA